MKNVNQDSAEGLKQLKKRYLRLHGFDANKTDIKDLADDLAFEVFRQNERIIALETQPKEKQTLKRIVSFVLRNNKLTRKRKDLLRILNLGRPIKKRKVKLETNSKNIDDLIKFMNIFLESSKCNYGPFNNGILIIKTFRGGNYKGYCYIKFSPIQK